MKIKIERSEKKTKEKKSFEVIFFYIMTIVFGVCFAFSVYNVTTYIQGLVEAGSLTVSSSIKDIIVYYINNCGSMLAYTVFAFGFVCVFKRRIRVVEEKHVQEASEDNQEVIETQEEKKAEEVKEEIKEETEDSKEKAA